METRSGSVEVAGSGDPATASKNEHQFQNHRQGDFIMSEENSDTTTTSPSNDSTESLNTDTTDPSEDRLADVPNLLDGSGEDPGDDYLSETGYASAPETYEAFELPEGFQLDEVLLDHVAPVLQELDTDQGQAQKLVDAYTQFQQAEVERVEQEYVERQMEWVRTLEEDPEFGGAGEEGRSRFDANIAAANKGAFYLGEDFARTLGEYGMQNHPVIVRALARLGQVVGEARLVTSGESPRAERRAADVMFPSVAGK
jgi:hypothetical protein